MFTQDCQTVQIEFSYDSMYELQKDYEDLKEDDSIKLLCARLLFKFLQHLQRTKEKHT